MALFVTFFKWLYHPDLEPSKRPKPPVVVNIPQLGNEVFKNTPIPMRLPAVLFIEIIEI
jgi:hypothetical protein